MGFLLWRLLYGTTRVSVLSAETVSVQSKYILSFSLPLCVLTSQNITKAHTFIALHDKIMLSCYFRFKIFIVAHRKHSHSTMGFGSAFIQFHTVCETEQRWYTLAVHTESASERYGGVVGIAETLLWRWWWFSVCMRVVWDDERNVDEFLLVDTSAICEWLRFQRRRCVCLCVCVLTYFDLSFGPNSMCLYHFTFRILYLMRLIWDCDTSLLARFFCLFNSNCDLFYGILRVFFVDFTVFTFYLNRIESFGCEKIDLTEFFFSFVAVRFELWQ